MICFKCGLECFSYANGLEPRSICCNSKIDMSKGERMYSELTLSNPFYKKEILLIGGTGSLGKKLLHHILENYSPKGIRIYSRDELKQWELQKEIGKNKKGIPIAFILGDVRNYDSVRRAMNRVDIVINCAAMKQVGSCENNVYEAIDTNIAGSRNVVNAAIDNQVKYCMHISTDKAVYPVNLYGKTKAVAEDIFLFGNTLSGNRTRFNVCRYGNVLGSRGSILPLFKDQMVKDGYITITDKKMTRFWITLDKVVNFICHKIENYPNENGVIYIPVMPSCLISSIAKLLFDKYTSKYIGIRKGEKIHECILTDEETVFATLSKDKNFIMLNPSQKSKKKVKKSIYSNNKNKINLEEIKKLLKGF